MASSVGERFNKATTRVLDAAKERPIVASVAVVAGVITVGAIVRACNTVYTLYTKKKALYSTRATVAPTSAHPTTTVLALDKCTGSQDL